MRLDRYFAKARIIDLKSAEFADALEELLATLPQAVVAKRTREKLKAELLEREKTIT